MKKIVSLVLLLMVASLVPLSFAQPPCFVDVVLCLDRSGSMSIEIAPGVTRLDALKTAAKGFIDALPEDGSVRVGLVSFEWNGHLDAGLTDINAANKLFLNGIIDGYVAGGNTNFEEPLIIARDMLAAAAAAPPGAPYVQICIFISNGAQNTGGDFTIPANDMKAAGVYVIAAGIDVTAPSPAADNLEAIASPGYLVLGIASEDDLIAFFDAIAATICAPVFPEFGLSAMMVTAIGTVAYLLLRRRRLH